MQETWTRLYDQLPHLASFSIPRWIDVTLNNTLLEFHGFSDASERAYAACLYLRVADSDGKVKCLLLASKSKVSPLKQVTLPRLELCGATILVRLIIKLRSALNLGNIPCFLWSDSTIVLSWIRGHPTNWKTYVANRVLEIQTTLPDGKWQHIAGTDNPADLASRGVSAQDLCTSSLWLQGPAFLLNTTLPWNSPNDHPLLTNCPEKRGVACIATNIMVPGWDLLTRYSTLTKLLRVTARCQEFIRRLRLKGQHTHANFQPLTTEHLESALKFWINHVQNSHFKHEFSCLTKKHPLPSKSSLIRLHPVLDDTGILRVGGRLRHSLLHPDQRHPVILPRGSPLTHLIVWDGHVKTLHSGTQLTLNYVRQRFWIVRGCQLVKSAIFKCLRCWRQRAMPTTQLMGDLTFKRVQPQRPFLHSGVDFAGLLHLRLSKGRGTKSYKGYIVVFVCLAIRAVHLEVAFGYSTQDFLHVFRRFVARRGICATITSDCGINFVGADKELRTLFEAAKFGDSAIFQTLANNGTKWCFNPPAAPHFGGIWEAAVKSVKLHLKRVIGETSLTFEELATLLTQIEACLNSRPLQPLTDDPTDLTALTPSHFLIGAPLVTLPEPSLSHLKISLLSRWQLTRQMYEHFWSRWSSEYLQGLQCRPKWQSRTANVQVGDLCLVRSNLLPPCKWPLARVTKTTAGTDGLIRVVELKTASSTLTRPITKISMLPNQRETLQEISSPRFGEGGRNVSD